VSPVHQHHAPRFGARSSTGETTICFCTAPGLRVDNWKAVNTNLDRRLRIAAINFLNPAPLMWDFEHPPMDAVLATRYQIERMQPSQCAVRLADGTADLGLIPIAALATTPGLDVLPGCAIASKSRVRSLILVRRATQPLINLRTVAADTASRTTIAHARILFREWGNTGIEFLPMAADLDQMLAHADAAILIGDPALLALEERANRQLRAGEELVYHDLAEEWHVVTGLPWVSAVWAAAPGVLPNRQVEDDFIQSRDHGLGNVDALVAEWSRRIAVPEATIRAYLTTNIHYVLDDECKAGMRTFFRMAARYDILPEYNF
jgi:chorismate dehydratase